MKIQKTFCPKPSDLNPNSWVLIDAQDQILGRLATKIADILRGKDTPEFSPHLVCGKGVVVINSSQIKTTGIKEFQKEYVTHSGFKGGDKYITLKDLMAKDPTKALEFAVKGMLPKNRLQDPMMTRLRIFPGPDHNLQAQKPEPIQL